jgi:restriction endonuclease S subunit
MIVHSIIQKSQLEGALRLDAEYYQPEYLNLISKIKNQKSKLLAEIGEIVYGTTPSGGMFEQSGIPFIRSQNFSNLLIDTSNLVFCSEKFNKQNKKSNIKPGDLLFAAVGATIGELAIVQDEVKEGNINQNIARIRIIDKNINPYFVGLFFASKLGQLQIERLVTGNAQFYLNSTQIGSFFIPIIDVKQQNKIAQYFQEIQNQIHISKSFYNQAENLLLEELGLKDFNHKENLSSVVYLSEIKSVNRMDAEYFQLKYEKILSKIKEHKAWKLGDLVSIRKGIEPGSGQYQDEGKLFIRVSSISKDEIIDKDQKYLSDELYQKLKKDYEPKIGEILLTKDATPGIAYVVKENIEGIISGGILRLKLKEGTDAEYVAFCINSIVGRLQSERDAGGSIIAHWKPEQIKNVLIPILPKSTQTKIADLVQKSHESRKKAKQLLEEAKQKVEELIEKK